VSLTEIKTSVFLRFSQQGELLLSLSVKDIMSDYLSPTKKNVLLLTGFSKHSFNLSQMFLINENMINNYKLVKETVFLEWNTKEDILKNVGN